MTNDILVTLDILSLKNLISAEIENFNDKLFDIFRIKNASLYQIHNT